MSVIIHPFDDTIHCNSKLITLDMCQAINPCKKLWVFDFDDTLAKTDSRVFLIGPDGRRSALTSHEYVTMSQRDDKNVTFDYHEFLRLINPRPIEVYVNLLHEARRNCGADHVYVLSARGVSDPIETFLDSIGVNDVTVIAAGDARPSVKATWVSWWLSTRDVKELEFFDDSSAHVDAIVSLRDIHPHVKIVTHHVVS